MVPLLQCQLYCKQLAVIIVPLSRREKTEEVGAGVELLIHGSPLGQDRPPRRSMHLPPPQTVELDRVPGEGEPLLQHSEGGVGLW